MADDKPIEDFGFTDTQLIELEDTERVVEQRSEQITKIAQSVTELHQVFKELAVCQEGLPAWSHHWGCPNPDANRRFGHGRR